jgi:hypothetical protein
VAGGSVTRPRLFPREPISPSLFEGVVVYASGTNRACDIRGALCAGVPVWVDICRLSPAATHELLRSALPVFLDSGAFSEVSFRDGDICMERPISDDQWHSRLEKYLNVARQLRRSRMPCAACAPVTVVAPDCVGSQEETLARLAKFRAQIRQVHALGADVVVPLQVGSLDVCDFYQKAKALLGIEIVPGMPMNKAATKADTIQSLIQAVTPKRIHLLGLGAENHKARPLIRFLRHLSPEILISMDANRIRAAVGKNRSITRSEKRHFDDLIPSWTGVIDVREWGGASHDFTELLFQPSHWLTGTELQQFAGSLTWLDETRKREFLRSPDEFVNTDENLNDWLYQSLTAAYFRYARRTAKRSARTRAVMEELQQSIVAQRP